MVKSFQKVFSTFVTLTTVLSTVGFGTLVAPGVASASTAGDLIKASGPAVYYYAVDGKRYVFPNEKTYFSWYADFSTVKTITDAELAAITIGGNVTIRPGTKLVKITTDPKVYAVTLGGVLHWIQDGTIATALYGANWSTKVVDVPDGFFVNYTVGSPISTAVHPDGSIVAYQGSTNRYVIVNGQKRLLTDSGWGMNRYNAANILPTTIVYPDGTQVSGYEGTLGDVIYIAGGVTPVGGSVSVALASDTPAGMTVPSNAVNTNLAKFTFTAGSAANISGMKFHRYGIGASADFANVYLYDDAGTRLTTGRTINSSTNYVEFNSLNIALAAGQSKSFVVVGDFATPGTTGGQHAFELADAASVIVTGSGTVSGSFPIRGNMFTVGTTQSSTITVTNGTNPSNPNIGQVDAEIANFRLAASTHDTEIRRVTLYQTGNISNTDLTNLKLFQGTTQVAAAASLTSDGHIVLNFTTPYLLTNGTTRVFSLKGTVGGRSGRSIRIYFEFATDVSAIDKTYNAGAAVIIGTTGSYDGVGSTVDCATTTNSSCTVTQGGQLTVTFDGPPTQNISKGQQDVPLYKFSLTSQSGQLEIRYVNFKIASTDGGAVKQAGGTANFTDIKVKDIDTGETVAGPVDITASAGDATSSIMALSGPINLNDGQTRHLAVTVDTSNLSPNATFLDHKFEVIFGNSGGNIFGSTDVRIVSTGESLATSKIVPNTAVTGNVLTVSAATLVASLASTPVSASYVKKSTGVETVGFSLVAGTQNDVTITAVKLTGYGTTGAPVSPFSTANFALLANSCKLYDGTTQVGLAQNPDTTTGAMNFTSLNVAIPRGGNKTLVAKCDITSAVTSTVDAIAITMTPSTDITAQDQDSNIITPSPATALNGTTVPTRVQALKQTGTLAIATDSLRSSAILLADNATWQNMAQFKATAQYEGMMIDKVTVTSTGIAANYSAIGIWYNGALLNSTPLTGANSSYLFTDVDLSATPINVAKDGTASFQIVGRLNNISASSGVSGVPRTGSSLSLGLAANVQTGAWNSSYANKYNVHVLGASSGDVVYATGVNTVGNTFVNRKAVPVITRQALASTTLQPGLSQEVAKFQIASGDPVNSVGVRKITLAWSKSNGAAFTLGSFQVWKGSSLMDTATYGIYAATATNPTGTGVTRDIKGASFTIAAGDTSGDVIIVFNSEETVSGSGNVYTLKATVSGTPTGGDNFSLQFLQDATIVQAAYLSDYAAADNVPNLDIGAAPGGTASGGKTGGYLLWSDMTEIPHTSVTTTATASYDWTNGYLVNDQSGTWTIAK